ncbi:MAG TPA: hypothetical protein VFZ65_05945 [Planctomycetota bacterium]|nr:hypothetical protein [Planctomycetota bacterium]
MNSSPLSLAPHLASAFLAVIAVAHSTAQCPSTWNARNTMPGFEDPWDAVGWDPDGAGPQPPRIVVSGRAGTAGSVIAAGMAFFDPATGTWSAQAALDTGTGIGLCLAVGVNNELFCGAQNGVFAWTGSSWTSLGTVQGASPLVTRLVVLQNGDLVAAGLFTAIGGVPANNVARWNGVTWVPLGAGVDNRITDAIVLQNGDLAVCGTFAQAGGSAVAGFAVWNGTSWGTLGGGPAMTGTAIAQLLTGEVVIAGYLGSTYGLRLWNGTSWTTFGAGTAEQVSSMAVLPNGQLVVGGQYFNSFGGVPAVGVAAWNGTTWSSLGAGLGGGGVLRLRTLPNGDLIAIGAFNDVAGAPARRIARWDGSVWSSLGDGINRPVHAARAVAGGAIVIGGEFTNLGTTSGGLAQRIALRDAFGWHRLGDGFDNTVKDIVELPNGDLIAVGLFTSSGTLIVNRVARWNGAVWSALGTGVDGAVEATVVMPNGDIVIGGHFLNAGGTPATFVARWDGTTWSALGTGFDGAVLALAALPNGDLVAGGFFNNVSGVATGGIARWNGSTWQAMGAGLPRTVRLHIAPDGTLIAAHNLGISRWTGAAWQQLGTANGADVRALASLPDGDLVAGYEGGSLSLPTLYFGNLLRWDGADWTQLPGTNAPIRSLTWLPSGELLVGGDFTSTSGTLLGAAVVSSPYLARLVSTCPAASTQFGAGCVGSAGPVALSSAFQPWIGSTFFARTTGVPANAAVVDVRGFMMSNVPLPPAIAGGIGCTLQVNPLFLGLATANAGVAETAIVIPDLAALIGQSFLGQSVVVEFGASGSIAQTTASNGLALTIGGF